MAHYAFLDEHNIVTEVITGKDETELIEGLVPETWYGNFRGQVCKRTSYNNKMRKQFAAIGYTYDEEADQFVKPQPYPSWSLDSNNDWQPPTAKPNNGKMYRWNESSFAWVEVAI
jgi:hypothetical protein